MVSLITSTLSNYSLQNQSTPQLAQESSRASLALLLDELPYTDGADAFDDDDSTVTTNRVAASTSDLSLGASHKTSGEDLRLLAVSAKMTEISYSVSDLQTRIFEIQELRHQVPEAVPLSSDSSTSAIDRALMDLDERLELVSKSMDELEQSLQTFSQTARTPTQDSAPDVSMLVLRKRDELVGEWGTVQRESEELRKELSDDKWLVVFRTVTDQADNMMVSLEKILNQCQDFMFQVQKKRGAGASDSFSSESIDYNHYLALANNLEAKKKYYMPSITKVLSILDKGIKEHSKNGECLRRHADSRARWRNVRERITRIDRQMESVKATLSESNELPISDHDSSASHGQSSTSKSRGSSTVSDSQSKSRSPSSLSFSRSMSPFRKLASRITRSTPHSMKTLQAPTTDPSSTVRKRASLFFGRSVSSTTTPDRKHHIHSQSLISPASSVESPSRNGADTPTKPKSRWNSSTKIETLQGKTPGDNGTIRPARSPLRPPIGANLFSDVPPVPALPRSVSRSSVGSSRPWSPFESSTMSTRSSQASSALPPLSRPVSRATTDYGALMTPRPRPKTPSNIPTPRWTRSVTSPVTTTPVRNSDHLLNRSLSPTFSTSGRRSVLSERCKTPSRIPAPRTPSGTLVPVPTLNLSRPVSSLSRRIGAQTPESTIRARALQLPVYGGARTPRPSLPHAPPSSYRSEAGTPIFDRRSTTSTEPEAFAQYTPNLKDPLDVEVAKTVNGMSHGFLIQRVDPPLRVAPPPGQELKAQYAVSNSLSRKVLNCRLVVIKRSSATADGGEGITKKVMCRVGGGWLDLHMYLLNHQAGS